MLAHVDLRSEQHVGRNGVDLEGFEAIVRHELNRTDGTVGLFVVDEIGKMECLSPVFVEAVTRDLNDSVPVLATIAAEGDGLIAKVKARPDVQIIEVTLANRERLPEELARRFQA